MTAFAGSYDLTTAKENEGEIDRNTFNSLKSNEENEAVAYYKKDDSPDRVKFEGLVERECVRVSEDEIIISKLPPIPDGGWGWVVVFAAFLVSACADGLAFSFGLLHEEFSKNFKASESETSMIGSLFIATPLLAGPIMSTLVDRYGCRVMTMIASVVSMIGFLLASVSNSIGMLCLTFGIISGLAMGVLYVTAVVSVAFWFDKRRNFAISLASCGIGFGTLLYSPLTHSLLSYYDWRNTIVILAGTLLNMCVCGALMRNPEWLDIKQQRERSLSRGRSRGSSRAGSISSRSLDGESTYLAAEELKSLLESGQSPEYILAMLESSIKEAEELEANTEINADPSYKRMHSATHLPTYIQRKDNVPPEVIEKLMENKRLYHIVLRNYPELVTRRRSETNLNADPPTTEAAIEPAILPIEDGAKKPKASKSEHDRKNIKDSRDKKPQSSRHVDGKPEEVIVEDIQPNNGIVGDCKGDAKVGDNRESGINKTVPNKPGQPTNPEAKPSWLRQISIITTIDNHYLRDMPLYKNTMMHRGAMMSIPRYRLKASSLPDMYRNSMESLDSLSDTDMKWYQRFWENIKSSFDVRMFTEFHFLMYNIASLIFAIWFIVPYFFLKSYMTAEKIDGEPVMVSIIGISSCAGIVALGWAADKPWTNVTKTYAVCIIICGLSVAAYPLVITSYWGLAFISCIFGLTMASSYSYTPAILMELMPLDRFTVAYGLILLSQGLGHLIGPPIGGALFDATGTWQLTFYMGGLWLIISGVCIGVIAFTKDRRLYGSEPLLKEAEIAGKVENGVSLQL